MVDTNIDFDDATVASIKISRDLSSLGGSTTSTDAAAPSPTHSDDGPWSLAGGAFKTVTMAMSPPSLGFYPQILALQAFSGDENQSKVPVFRQRQDKADWHRISSSSNYSNSQSFAKFPHSSSEQRHRGILGRSIMRRLVKLYQWLQHTLVMERL